MTPKQVLAHYGIHATKKIEPISVGLMHATYKIETADGSEFVLQQLHPALSHVSVTKDYFAVTEHLAECGIIAQEVVRTRTGELVVLDSMIKKNTVKNDRPETRTWRLLTYIPGEVFNVVKSPARARACGAAVAEFHEALATLPHTFKSKLPLHPYAVDKFYRAFAAATKKFVHSPLMEEKIDGEKISVHDEVDFLLKEIPKLLLPDGLPTRVVHGDLKITNFVFDEAGRDVRTIIDLDTCARFPVLYELGDALRSWCGRAEDDPNNKFNVAIYHAAVEGYFKAMPKFLSAREKKLLPRAVKLIILNLASRFLRDYFEDNYFGFDAKKYSTRRAANLARARGQIALYRDMVKKI